MTEPKRDYIDCRHEMQRIIDLSEFKKDDDLRPARGVHIGALLGFLLWIMVIIAFWYFGKL